MRSRVMPGSSPTMERREPTIRLKSVDLPTLGRPTIARVGCLFLRDFAKSSFYQCECERVREIAVSEDSLLRRSAMRTNLYYIGLSGIAASQMSSFSQSAGFATGASPSPEHVTPELPSLHQFFSPGGMLAQSHPGYEFRRGQLQMAQAVEQ